MPTSAVNGTQLYWELSGGTGEPVVLVHGSWGDHLNWALVVPALSSSFRVATYDRRGHSRSERLPEQGTIHDDVADLAGLIAHVFGEPAHVIGNSFGAAIALNLAVQRPQAIRSLVVHEPPLFGLLEGEPGVAPALATVKERIAGVAALLEAGQNEAGARQFVETIAFGPGAWDQLPQATRDTFVFNAPTWLDEQREPGWMALDLARLSAFKAPTLLSFGGESPPFFPLAVQRIAQALPHARQNVFPQAGHVPHLSHPSDYVRVVTEFLGTADAAGAAVRSLNGQRGFTSKA